MSGLSDLQDQAMAVRDKYEKFEVKKYGQSWTVQQLADGYKKDVDDLIEILNEAQIDKLKLKHELADCLWSVLVISKKMGINLEQSFYETMAQLHERLDKELT